jgi:ribosomal protein S18 acetylase RimI-like enzyme
VLIIRDATLNDVPAMLQMLRDSACDQGFEGEVSVTEADLTIEGFGPNPRFQTLIAEWNGQRAGLALFFFMFSSWGSKSVLYLEDLYVPPEFRRKGIARSLLVHLAEIARARKCVRIQWVVHIDNAPAIRAYEAAGAKVLDDWRLMSLKGEAIDLLAGEATSVP